MRCVLVIAACVVVLPGCTTFHLVRPNEPVPRYATVAVTFDEPRDLEARLDRSVYPLPAVNTVYGEVVDVRSDTVELRVLRVESGARQPRLPEEARLTIVHSQSAQLSASRISKGRTAGAVALAAAGAFALFLSQLEW